MKTIKEIIWKLLHCFGVHRWQPWQKDRQDFLGKYKSRDCKYCLLCETYRYDTGKITRGWW